MAGAFIGEGFQKAFDAERWVGNEDVKGAVLDFRISGVVMHKRIRVTNADAGLLIHEGGDFRDLGEAVFLFDTVDAFVIVGEVFQWVMDLDKRFQLKRKLVDEVAGTAGVVDGFGRIGGFFTIGSSGRFIRRNRQMGISVKYWPSLCFTP